MKKWKWVQTVQFILVFLLLCLTLYSVLYFSTKSNETYHREKIKPSMIIAGLARDISLNWQRTKQSLAYIFEACPQYGMIIIESNSKDNTRNLLQQWSQEDSSKRHVLSLGYLPEKNRTKRLAYCRNAYMEELERLGWFESSPFMIVVDLDNLELSPAFGSQLTHCLLHAVPWDAIASNRLGPYYDIWALRSEELGVTFDCWERVKNDHSIPYNHRIERYIKKYQKVIPNSPGRFIRVQSAFGGMVLYKASSIRKRRYDGSDTCEHVSFHKNLDMYLFTDFISGLSDEEHV